MADDFKVGDVVVCIKNATPKRHPLSEAAAATLKKGSIHRITDAFIHKNGKKGVKVSGACADPHPGFGAHLFRKLPPADPDFIKLIREIKPTKELEKV